jgi:hypothetical protein
MDMDLLNAAPAPRFVRETPPQQRRDELAAELERERERRIRAERVASDMVRMVAHESRRAEIELERRLSAEKTASAMARLVAQEGARAERAETRLRELLDG